MARLMSDAELRRRKKAQAHLSQIGGTLGLAALGTKGAKVFSGSRAAKKVPGLVGRKIRTANPQKLENTTTGLLTAGAGLGGAGAFNFAAVQNAEARKRPRKPVAKAYTLEMGSPNKEGISKRYFDELEEIEKKKRSQFDAEKKRLDRAQKYKHLADVTTGAATVGAGAYAAKHSGELKGGLAEIKRKKFKLQPKDTKASVKMNLPVGVKLKPAGKVAGAVGLAGGAAATAHHIRRETKEGGSWRSHK